jgi:hypothetical protein
LRAQIDEQVRKKAIAPMSVEQFIVTLASSCLFPFAARPMVTAALGLDSRAFTAFIKRRRKELPAFLKRALRR